MKRVLYILFVLSQAAVAARLPKPHYYWPCKDDTKLVELIQTTGTFCIYVDSSGEATVRRNFADGVAAIRQAITSPSDWPTVALMASPWHRVYDSDDPRWDERETYKGEIEFFRERLKLCKTLLDECGLELTVSAIILDTERLKGERTPVFLYAQRQALDLIHAVAKDMFPDVIVIWYGRGMGWNRIRRTVFPRTNWTGEEMTDVLSTSLYYGPDVEAHQLLIAGTAAMRDLPVIPHLALGAAYCDGVWTHDATYDVEASRETGRLVAQTERVTAVVLYPPPYDPRSPQWEKHWHAYLEGIQGVE